MSRLTIKNEYDCETLYGSPIGTKCDDLNHLEKVYTKLGRLEDILEEYGIEDLTDLKIALNYYNHRFDGLHTERVGNDEQH